MRPDLSFIVLTHSERHDLSRCLASLESAGAASTEVWVGVNGKDDRIEEDLRRWSRRRPWLRWAELPRMARGAARNNVARQASGGLLYFLDDDVTVPPGFVQRVRTLAAAHPRAAFIGGPNLGKRGAGAFERAVERVLTSPLGAGPMRRRYRAEGAAARAPGWAFMLCNLGVRADAFGQGFPELCVSAEENLLLHRLEALGLQGIFSPSLAVRHKRRGTLASFCAQARSSGAGRAQITRADPRSFQAAVLAPPALAACAVGAALGASLAPLAAYAAAVAFETARLARHDPRAAAWLACLLPAAHLSYAAGLASGFLTGPADHALDRPRLSRNPAPAQL